MRAVLVSLANQLAFALIHYLALAIAALLAYSIGRRLTRSLSYHSAFESLVFSTALGLGVVAYLILFLGLLKILYVPVFVAVLLGLFAFGITEFRGFLKWRDWRQLRLNPGLVLGFVLVIPILILPLYPPTAWDATMYHLASGKIFATEHAVVFTPFLRYAVAPMLNQMLFAGALLVGDAALAQQIELLMFALSLLALFSFARRHLNHRSGLLAAALLISSPYMILLGAVAYIDVCLMLYCFLACYAFWNWRETGESAWLVASGIGLGFAIATKYPALFFLLLLAPSVLVFRKSLSVRRVLIFGGLALLIASPWFIRNFYYTHNPVFPFFHESLGSLFGYGVWSPEYYAGQGGRGLNEGLGRGIRELVMLPWNLTSRPREFAGELPISPLYVVVLPFAILAALKIRSARFVLSVAVAFTLFWFFTYQSLRYLLPALPFFCLAAAGGIDFVISRWKRMARVFDHPLAIAAVCVAIAAPGLTFALFEVYHERWLIPLKPASRDQYIGARLPTYPLYQHLNQLRGRNYKVYALYDENLAYYADGVHMGDWFGPARFSRLWPALTSGEALWRELRTLGADYFLVNEARLKVTLPDDAYFRSHFRLILRARDSALYELSEPRQTVRIGPRW